jgi:hypothetical protein
LLGIAQLQFEKDGVMIRSFNGLQNSAIDWFRGAPYESPVDMMAGF